MGWDLDSRRERSDAVESRRRVVGAARRLFEERGVDTVSMHEIGRAAGVGQGTLYRRFEHKGALCVALLREEIESLRDEARSRLADEGGSALAGLEWFLGRLAEFNEENAPLLGAIRDAAGGERRLEMHGNPFYEWLRETVAAQLSLAVRQGEAASGLDVECAADFVLAPLDIDLYLFQRREMDMERERITRALRAFIRGGVQSARP